MVKVFTVNKDNKIEFSKDELEKILNEVWQNGYNSHQSYWWTSPTITSPCYSTSTLFNGDGVTISNTQNSIKADL